MEETAEKVEQKRKKQRNTTSVRIPLTAPISGRIFLLALVAYICRNNYRPQLHPDEYLTSHTLI